MKWASALAQSGNLEEAVERAVEELCARLGSREPDLLIAFASPSLVEHADVAELLHARLPRAVLVGCSGEGIIGANHYPVQDFWLCRVARRPDGKFQTETVRKVLEDDVDPYAAECRMR